MLAWLAMMLVEGAVSLLTFIARQGWEGIGPDTVALGVYLTLSALVISVALSFAGLLCRGRYGWLRLSLWLALSLLVAWLLVIVPLALLAMIASGGRVPLAQFLVVMPGAAVLTFGVMLPFLVLSFANGFYRKRLKGLLHLTGTGAPPVITAPVSAVPDALGG